MELLKNHPGVVRFPVPTGLTSATFKVYRNDTVIGQQQNAVFEGGVAVAKIPYSVLTEEGEVKVVLSFVYEGGRHEVERRAEVVTPYLDLYEVKKILENDDDEEARQVEAGVRHIINAHCGQSFGYWKGKQSITGSGESYLVLPRRLIAFASVNNSNYTATYNLMGGGYYLSFKKPWGVPPIRADYDGWNEASSGVISAPSVSVFGKFIDMNEYVIDGEWGWRNVPYPIQEAAKLLVNDYGCGDSLYRDRYLTSMTAADWRIQFHEGAFHDTGNVRANQLLSDYVVPRGWVVI